jgi:hypothetical protein
MKNLFRTHIGAWATIDIVKFGLEPMQTLSEKLRNTRKSNLKTSTVATDHVKVLTLLQLEGYRRDTLVRAELARNTSLGNAQCRFTVFLLAVL